MIHLSRGCIWDEGLIHRGIMQDGPGFLTRAVQPPGLLQPQCLLRTSNIAGTELDIVCDPSGAL